MCKICTRHREASNIHSVFTKLVRRGFTRNAFLYKKINNEVYKLNIYNVFQVFYQCQNILAVIFYRHDNSAKNQNSPYRQVINKNLTIV